MDLEYGQPITRDEIEILLQRDLHIGFLDQLQGVFEELVVIGGDHPFPGQLHQLLMVEKWWLLLKEFKELLAEEPSAIGLDKGINRRQRLRHVIQGFNTGVSKAFDQLSPTGIACGYGETAPTQRNAEWTGSATPRLMMLTSRSACSGMTIAFTPGEGLLSFHLKKHTENESGGATDALSPLLPDTS